MNAKWVGCRSGQAQAAAAFDAAARRAAAEIANAGLTPADDDDGAGSVGAARVRVAELAYQTQWKAGPLIANAAAAVVAYEILAEMDAIEEAAQRHEFDGLDERQLAACLRCSEAPFAVLVEHVTRAALGAVPRNAISRSTSPVSNLSDDARAAAYARALDAIVWARGDEP